ncbi:MAG TPA: hypothetical protein VNS34_11245 [Rhizobiaceae bacterium]|nr:hypothetical protein [Rhizobiaceae bacterium]
MRRFYHLGGALITLASIGFVVLAIAKSYGNLPETIYSGEFVGLIVCLGLAYAGINQFLGAAWYSLLFGFGRGDLDLPRALAIFNRTQIYKYLPGNVFHMVGRYAMANKAGAPHTALSLAQMGELALVLLAALTVAGLFSKSVLVASLGHYGLSDPIYVGLLPLAVAVAGFVIWKVGLVPADLRAVLSLLAAIGLYLLFIISNAFVAVIVAKWIGSEGLSVAQIIAAASTAWLVGFVVPGAPGGLGVREAVTIAGLTALGLPTATATAVAVGHRIVTISGDALGALFEIVLRRWH